MTTNRFVRIVLNGSKALSIGLALAVLPWLGSIYLCPQISNDGLKTDSALSANQSAAKASRPDLLPAVEPARYLLANNTEEQPDSSAEHPIRQIADSPAPQTGSNDSVMETETIASEEAEKSESKSVPHSGLIIEDDIDGAPGDASPPLWAPKEEPIAEINEATSQMPKTPGTAANPTSSAESAQAGQNTAANTQSRAPSTGSEHVYTSTEPALNEKAVDAKPIGKEPPVRSEQLESIARQADTQTRHGFELAGRGAYCAARSEFISALRLVAQGLDADGRTKIHGKSLAAALTALKEAEDFLSGGARLEADLDLTAVISGHATPALKNTDTSSLTALTAMKAYFTYAQEKFAQAEGNEVAGSMALRALGKLHEELAKGKGAGTKAAGQKAVVFYQAALMVCPQNLMAANDLGVMFARNGNYEQARKMLEYSLSLRKQSDVWHNLAVVYERLGRGDMVNKAQQQAQIALQMERASRKNASIGAKDQVCWIDENSFAQTYNPSAIRQEASSVPVASGKPLLQQAAAAPAQPRAILQPASNQYKPPQTGVNTIQTPQTPIRPLPVLQPAVPERISKTPNNNLR
jgi:tetratricopeptide (TPR) repeat protein